MAGIAATLASMAVSGTPPSEPSKVPDEAFRPVILPTEHPPIWDFAVTPAPTRPQPHVDQPKPQVAVVPTPTPKATHRATSAGSAHALSGMASWYCKAGVSVCHYQYPDGAGFDAYAAAGPRLRAAICGTASSDCWRGRAVTVNGIRVRLIDWCQCFKGEASEKIIDLYWDVAHALDIGGEGRVTIRW